MIATHRKVSADGMIDGYPFLEVVLAKAFDVTVERFRADREREVTPEETIAAFVQTFSLQGLGIRQPDKVIDMMLTDESYRDSEGLPYPFLGAKDKYSGCYALFSFPDPFYDILRRGKVWYVGKAGAMHTRLSQHWSGGAYSTVIDHVDEMNDGQTPFVWAAIWFEPIPRGRMLLEHELIAKFKPAINKG